MHNSEDTANNYATYNDSSYFRDEIQHGSWFVKTFLSQQIASRLQPMNAWSQEPGTIQL